MKLIRCSKCNDVIRLVEKEWRMCDCKKSGGQYNKDFMTATIGGKSEVFGISNLFFDEDFRKLSEKEKVRFRKKINHFTSEIWWGEMQGDNQIHRIKSGKGPRLKMKVEWIDKNHTKSIFLDRRKYSINLKRNKKPKFVIVENKMKPSFKNKNN